MRIIKIITVIFILLFSILYLFYYSNKNIIGNTEGTAQIIKNFIPQPIKNILKSTLFKDAYIKEEIKKQNKFYKKVNSDKISIYERKMSLIESLEINSKENNKYFLKKYNFPYFDHNSWGKKPPGYIDIYKNYLIIINGQADFLFFDLNELNDDKINFDFIASNFDNFIDKKKYILPGITGPRDLEIINDEIFISYIDKDSCDKVSIAKAKINFNFLQFEKFYSWNGCVNNELGFNDDKTLLDQRNAGRIRNADDDHIFFTIGNYYQFSKDKALSQDMDSLFGSIIKINKTNKNYSIISKGHRNQQGLYFDQKTNYLLTTEHGPQGGDELNILNLNDEEIQNFGWPISSYGVHYPSHVEHWKKIGAEKIFNKLAPLKKSHSKFGFKEPLKYWTPSIGISEIIKIPNSFNNKFKNDYFVAAMGNVIEDGDQTIHHLRLNKSNENIIFEDKIIIKERIRDLVFNKNDNSIILMLGSEPSIAVLYK